MNCTQYRKLMSILLTLYVTLYNVYVGQLRDLKVKLSGEMIVLNVKVVLILQRFHEC